MIAVAYFCFLLSLPVALWLLLLWGALKSVGRRYSKRARWVAVIAVHLVVATGLMFTTIARTPAVTIEPMSVADKISLRKEMKRDSTEQLYKLSFEGPQLSRFVRTGAGLVGPDIHPQVQLADSALSSSIALRLPLGFWVNVQVSGRAEVRQGRPRVRLDHLVVGNFPVVQPLRWYLVELALAGTAAIPRASTVLSSVEQMNVDGDCLHVSVKRNLHLLAAVAGDEGALADAGQQRVAGLIAAWQRDVRLEEPAAFVPAVRRLFRLATELAPNETVVEQNRIALAAGAVIFGHVKLAEFLAEPLEGEPRAQVQSQRKLKLHGRQDLSRHFWTSVGLALVGNSSIADAMGLAKEEVDSGAGGSGFSFVDLTADRAGVRFAEVVGGAEMAAVLGQELRTEGWAEQDVCPDGTDLPEGIPQDVLENEFRGGDGSLYRELERTIEWRLSQCRLLRDRAAS